MYHLKQVGEYWDLRSHGFSDAINEELDSHLGEAWKKRFTCIGNPGGRICFRGTLSIWG